VSEHACNWRSAWPTGHQLPPEDPAKLTGPEVGQYMMYAPKSSTTRWKDGVQTRDPDPEPVVVRVIHRSYVWSPGECRHKGGYRRYDWSVIEKGPDKYRAVVVNDSDLYPVDPAVRRIVTVYSVPR